MPTLNGKAVSDEHFVGVANPGSQEAQSCLFSNYSSCSASEVMLTDSSQGVFYIDKVLCNEI